LQTRCSVFQGDATESKDWDFRVAGLAQGIEARGWRSGSASFSEYRSEDDEVGFLRLGAQDIGSRVTGGGNEKVAGGSDRQAEKLHNRAHFPSRQIVRPQMDAVGSHSQRDIGAGVN
jgi:hypothetical protein